MQKAACRPSARCMGIYHHQSVLLKRLLWQMLLKSLVLTLLHQGIAAATQADDAAALIQFQADTGMAAGWTGTQPCASGESSAGSLFYNNTCLAG